MDRRLLGNRRRSNATASWLAAVAFAAASAHGCSFLFSEGAPSRYRERESFACGESFAPPVLDVVAGGVLALGAASGASKKEETVAAAAPVDRPAVRRDANVAIGLSVVFAAVSTASAIYGFHAASTCREAKEERLVALQRARALPPPYGLPPWGAPPPYWPPPSWQPATQPAFTPSP